MGDTGETTKPDDEKGDEDDEGRIRPDDQREVRGVFGVSAWIAQRAHIFASATRTMPASGPQRPGESFQRQTVFSWAR